MRSIIIILMSSFIVLHTVADSPTQNVPAAGGKPIVDKPSRQQMIEEYRRVLLVPKDENRFEEARNAILGLAAHNAIESAELVAEHLSLGDPSLLRLWETRQWDVTPISDVFPAIAALMQMGPGAMEALLNVVARGSLDETGKRHAGLVIVRWYEKNLGQGIAVIEAFAALQPDAKQKERLERVADVVRGFKAIEDGIERNRKEVEAKALEDSKKK